MLVLSMDEGYILSNKYRRTIFDELASGETSIERIAKKNRIIKNVESQLPKNKIFYRINRMFVFFVKSKR
jgi:hypothetical protein